MTDPSALARLRELARQAAMRNHDDDIWDEDHHSGLFAICPHPDCLLVRAEPPAVLVDDGSFGHVGNLEGRDGVSFAPDAALSPDVAIELARQANALRAELEGAPNVVCLCGSTKFIEQFAVATWVIELRGDIVLGCTLLPWWYAPVRSHFAEAQGVKAQRDEHHLRKIDLSTEVLVLNIDGYIGESTSREIAYANETGKPVRYVTDDPELLAAILPLQPSPPEGSEA